MGELYTRLREYGEGDFYPYHMPGHKRHKWGELPEEIVKIDITEIEGFDNLHQPEGILQRLQEKAAALYGADESFYLINGSSCGVLTAISAALSAGGHILMARNCHKSAYHAAYLRNLTISYLYPTRLEEYDICEAITPKQVAEALEKEADIGAVLIVSPTYEGRMADVKAIAEIVHKKGIPLIVDEAHGAHLGLVPGQKPNSCQQGADIVIHSVHKTLPAMTQTALLHVKGERIHRDRLRRFLHIYQSSSPSYVLMASIDNALRVVEAQGEMLFEAQRKNFTELLDSLRACRCLRFLPLEDGQDIGKLVISSKKTGLSGQQIYDMLLEKYHLQLEMAAGSYCLAMFTIGDTEEAYTRLTQALLAIDRAIAEGQQSQVGSGEPRESAISAENGRESRETAIPENAPAVVSQQSEEYSEEEISLAEAWEMEGEQILLQEAAGRRVGDFINLYPPGVPLAVPGEILTQSLLDSLEEYLEQGLQVQGVEKRDSFYIKVLK